MKETGRTIDTVLRAKIAVAVREKAAVVKPHEVCPNQICARNKP